MTWTIQTPCASIVKSRHDLRLATLKWCSDIRENRVVVCIAFGFECPGPVMSLRTTPRGPTSCLHIRHSRRCRLWWRLSQPSRAQADPVTVSPLLCVNAENRLRRLIGSVDLVNGRALDGSKSYRLITTEDSLGNFKGVPLLLAELHRCQRPGHDRGYVVYVLGCKTPWSSAPVPKCVPEQLTLFWWICCFADLEIATFQEVVH